MFGTPFGGDFHAALDTLASRGPDERGVWADPDLPDVMLGHRRLSIIDLVSGQQPMQLVDDDRFVIAYNGELFNFRELRRDLEKRGRRFATDSDTEVLLAGYAEWGEAVLPKLDGMFAFVVWDRKEREVFAARDRFGIKPLVWSSGSLHGHGGRRGSKYQSLGLVVASTLAPFFRLTGFPRRLRPGALHDYLASQAVQSPWTVLSTCHALMPGGTLRWRYNQPGPTIGSFWEVPHAASPEHQPGFDELLEATDAALRESVTRQLVADVPLGAFLSGGIDSSLMVRHMAEASSSPVKTFAVRFPFGRGYDESDAAAAVAEAFGCEHHVFDAGDIDGAALADAAALLDQPLADPAILPTLALSELTRKHVTVAISGDGGDELFGGYDRYSAGTSRYPSTPLQRLLARLGFRGRRALAGRDRVLWNRVKLGPFPGTRKDLLRLMPTGVPFAEGEVMGYWLSLVDRFRDRVTGEVDADALMRADLHTYLSENCLAKTDRASMAHALEVRVPILGNPVADVALPVHADVKLKHGLKSVLVELAKRDLPAAVWDRPKHGFSVPLREYFAGAWRERCEDWVSRCEALAPFLNAKEVRRRWASPREDARTKYTLIHLLAWLDTHPVDF